MTPPRISSARVCALVLAVATVLLFWPSIRFGFLNWDDDQLLTQHPWYLPVTYKSLFAMWNPLSLWEGKALDYSPIRDLSYALDLWVWGWNPFGFHLTNVLLHAANGILVFLFLLNFCSFGAAWIGSMLWAWHPLAIEPVAWVSGRKDLLMACFVLIALHLAHRNRWFEAFGSGLAALLSKYTALPLGIIFLTPIGGNRSSARRTRTSLGLIVFGLAIVGFALAANRHRGEVIVAQKAEDFVHVWPAALQVVTHAVQSAVWPTALSARYVQHPELGWFNHSVAGGAALLVATMIALFYLLRKLPAAGKGLLFGALTFLPYLPIVPTNIWMADRYLYLSLVGGVWGWVALLDTAPGKVRRALLLSSVILAGLSAWQTRARLPVWKDSLSLWSDTVQRSPSLYYVWGNLGQAQLETGHTQEAIRSFERAYKLNSAFKEAWLFLGQAYVREGRKKVGIEALVRFETESPETMKTRRLRERAIAWAETGEKERAEKLFKEQLRNQPTDPVAWGNLGVLYVQSGRDGDALDAWNRAIRVRPDLPVARLNRGRYRFLHGECDGMKEDFRAFREMTGAERMEIQRLKNSCR